MLTARSIILAALAATILPTAAAAQPLAAVTAAQDSVVSYPAAFFAEYNPRTAADMLGRLPAFSINDGDGGRGLGAGGNVLIDGERPTSKSDSLGDILGRLQASSIDRIELIRGAAPGVDMQGYTVVANVVRRRGIGLKGSAAVHLFSTGGNGGYQLEGQAQKAMGEHNFSAAFEIRPAADPRTKSVQARRTEGGELIIETERASVGHGRDYEATVAYQGPVGPGRLSATLIGDFGDDERRSYETALAPNPGLPVLDASGSNYDHAEVDLSYVWPLADFAESELTLVAQRSSNESDSFAGASTFSQIRDSAEIVGLAALRFRPIGAWTLNGGMEVAFNSLDTTSVLNAGGQSLANPVITVEELRGEGFAAARWAYGPRLNFEFGLRYEVSNISTGGAAAREKTLSFAKPRFLATFARAPREQISLRIEREVGQLSFSDFSATVSLTNGSAPIAGNPDLEPARAWVAQARYEKKFGKQGAFVVAATHKAHEEQVLTGVFLVGPALPPPARLLPGTYYEAADNVEGGSQTYIDVDLSLPLGGYGLPGGLLTLHGGGDRTRIIDPTTGESRDFSGQSPYEWSFMLSQDIASRGFRWEIKGSGRPANEGFRPTELSFSDPEPNISIAIEQTWGPIWIRTGFNNVTGQKTTTVRRVYDNPRGRGAIRFVEFREQSDSPFFYFLVRRTF